MEKLLKVTIVVPFLLEFLQVSYIVRKIVAKATKCHLNHITTTFMCLPAVEKPIHIWKNYSRYGVVTFLLEFLQVLHIFEKFATKGTKYRLNDVTAASA